MIKFHLNGKLEEVEESTYLAWALKQWHYPNKTFAVAVNEVFVPRSQYQSIMIREYDRIEIVGAMQGG